ncbi:MAG TPA: hypothetical protein PKD41_01280 [Solidesulfovibrio sp.]|nr:hypothetical protein [Solidesulfovibrio sp.]
MVHPVFALSSLLLVALLASLALAGQSDVYGPKGAYQGRIVERPGDTGQADVYGPTGGYQGTTQEKPAGQQ